MMYPIKANVYSQQFVTYSALSTCTSTEEFENGVFTLKAHQMSFVHKAPAKFKNATFAAHFGCAQQVEENVVKEIKG